MIMVKFEKLAKEYYPSQPQWNQRIKNSRRDEMDK